MLFGKRKRIVKRILIVEDEPWTAFDNETMLRDAGYEVVATIDRFADAPDEVFLDGRSATYLRDTGQERDLAFILEHVDDLEAVFVVEQGEVRVVATT